MSENDERSPDHLERRCRMLGHEIRFGYCRLLPEGRPCRLIVDCWQGTFDVMAYLQERYSPEQIESFLAPPKAKITSILELVEKARQVSAAQQPRPNDP